MIDQILPPAPSLAGARPLAHGSGWRATEVLCTAGPGDRPFEERHDQVTIASVVEGAFTYRSGKSRALLHAGALLLGNAGACYECGHDHGRGDRCVALNIEADLFGEIAASRAGDSRFSFPTSALYAAPGLSADLVRIGHRAWDPLARDIATIQIVERVLGSVAEKSPTLRSVSAKDEQRIVRALAFIDTHATDRLDLHAIARASGTSKFHFLRTFRQHVGVTPYRYVLDLRLRRAAKALATSTAAITSVALDAGFGDLSTFYRQFNAAFGQSPQAYRQKSLKTGSPLARKTDAWGRTIPVKRQ